MEQFIVLNGFLYISSYFVGACVIKSWRIHLFSRIQMPAVNDQLHGSYTIIQFCGFATCSLKTNKCVLVHAILYIFMEQERFSNCAVVQIKIHCTFSVPLKHRISIIAEHTYVTCCVLFAKIHVPNPNSWGTCLQLVSMRFVNMLRSMWRCVWSCAI